jgi:predicted ATPase
VEALALFTDAFERVEETGERWFEAELHRRRGEVLLCLSDADNAEAERCFRQAMAVAQAQGTKLWELRAAMSLARLWADQGERARAHDLLAPIYGWFTEGFETADLKDAKALLDELA